MKKKKLNELIVIAIVLVVTILSVILIFTGESKKAAETGTQNTEKDDSPVTETENTEKEDLLVTETENTEKEDSLVAETENTGKEDSLVTETENTEKEDSLVAETENTEKEDSLVQETESMETEKPSQQKDISTWVPTEDELDISPYEQMVIDAGYGNVVDFGDGDYGVLMKDANHKMDGKDGFDILEEYLARIGLCSSNMSGGWIDDRNGWYMYIAKDVREFVSEEDEGYWDY